MSNQGKLLPSNQRHYPHPGGEHLFHIIKRNPATFFISAVLTVCIAVAFRRNSPSKWRLIVVAIVALGMSLRKRRQFDLKLTAITAASNKGRGSSIAQVDDEKIRAYYEFLLYAARQLALPIEERDPKIWGMKGSLGQVMGMEVGPKNSAFTSIRYHAAFLGYAIAVHAIEFNLHYLEDTRMALRNVVECLLRYESWSYMKKYWPDDKPMTCRENVMWSGHVLHCATLYELLTGDDCYRRKGGLVCRDQHGEIVDVSDVESLANLCAEVMDQSITGGMACEPGLVFPQCQSHVFVAHWILERLTGQPGKYQKQRQRWEDYLLRNMKAPLDGGGAYAVFIHEKSGIGLPFAHLGSDGWASHYHFAWTRDTAIPKSIWWQESRPALASFDTLETQPSLEHHGAASCCMPLAIPASVWVGSLLPVAAMAEDAEFSTKMQDWLERYFAKPAIVVNERFMLHLDEGPEWLVGTTSNFLQGLVLMRNPIALRKLVTEFNGIQSDATPVVQSIQPYETTRVLRCELLENQNAFRLKLSLKKLLDQDSSNLREVTLILDNIKNVLELELMGSSNDGTAMLQWEFDTSNRLRLKFGSSIREMEFIIRFDPFVASS